MSQPKFPTLTVVAYLPLDRHATNCAVYDPTPDPCTCGLRGKPLVTLESARAAVEAAYQMGVVGSATKPQPVQEPRP